MRQIVGPSSYGANIPLLSPAWKPGSSGDSPRKSLLYGQFTLQTEWRIQPVQGRSNDEGDEEEGQTHTLASDVLVWRLFVCGPSPSAMPHLRESRATRAADVTKGGSRAVGG